MTRTRQSYILDIMKNDTRNPVGVQSTVAKWGASLAVRIPQGDSRTMGCQRRLTDGTHPAGGAGRDTKEEIRSGRDAGERYSRGICTLRWTWGRPQGERSGRPAVRSDVRRPCVALVFSSGGARDGRTAPGARAEPEELRIPDDSDHPFRQTDHRFRRIPITLEESGGP